MVYSLGKKMKMTISLSSMTLLVHIVLTLFFVQQALLCYNDPESHPYISDKEKKYLEEALGRHQTSHPSAIPWKAIFMSVPLWALVCAQVRI